MISLIVSADRKPPTNDAESAAFLRTMVSYSGKYTVDAKKFVTTPDVSWNEIYTGHEQVRYYKLNGNKLFTRTAEEPSALFPGKRIVATTEWVREEWGTAEHPGGSRTLSGRGRRLRSPAVHRLPC